jgi:hypothetical protein
MIPEARDQNRCALAAEVLRASGELKLQAMGLSMLPSLWPGDLLTIQSSQPGRFASHIKPSEIKPGEIVLYVREQRFFIHRVVRNDLKCNGFLISRGDCMAEDDPPVQSHELLGKITAIRRGSRLVEPVRRLSVLRRMMAYWLCRSNFLRQIVLQIWKLSQADDCRAGSSLFANRAFRD